MLYELLYTSCADREFNQQDLLNLLQQAREHNHQTGITGLLVYHQREFMQLLEGEESVVRGLWQRIFHDPRHRSPQIMHEEPIDQRSFPEWSMAFLAEHNKIDPEISRSLSNYLDNRIPLEVLSSHSNIGYKLLRNLRNMFTQQA